ncbi:PepSY-associated TM helix domain-containing protein [Maribacter antarcticus]|uniref:PepSY-associated TM helix domain-containing protein n=1 Tax=Maribacter antarcticus TaxID=505250 RepID=UPI000479C4A7|nr:PepSY-associated TM helix domain-containing protein [Maribacter antarcticus]
MKILSKKLFFHIHSWIGVQLSILFFIVCFSGTLATLSNEYDWLFFPEIRAVDNGKTASYNNMVSNIQKAYPEGRIGAFFGTDEAYLCTIVHVINNKQRYYVFVNPYTGKVQGATTLTFQRFFRNLHYFLYIPPQIGNYVVLFFGFTLLISSLTALYFYKKWWKKLFQLKIGKGKLVFYRSLHRLVGIWSVPFAILFSVTGIWYFAERSGIGAISKKANPSVAQIQTPDNVEPEKLEAYTLDFDKAVKIAEAEIPNLKVMTVLPPRDTKSSWYLTGKSDVPLVRNRANRVYLHPLNYTVLTIQEADKISTVTWLNDAADPLHFGNWGGLVTKIIWFIGGMAISSLILTGVWIYVKRNSRRKKKKPKIWLYINWSIVAVINFCMFTVLRTRYLASYNMLIVLGISVLLLILLTWYLFVKKMRIKEI